MLPFQNRNLKGVIQKYKKLVNVSNINTIEYKYFPNISLINKEGETKSLLNSFDSRECLLFVFSPDCIECDQMIKKVEQFYNENSSNFRIIGLSASSLEETKKFFADNRISYPVYCISDVDQEYLEFNHVPLTLFLSQKGKILRAIIGDHDISRRIQ